jgi:hypothetical protein
MAMVVMGYSMGLYMEFVATSEVGEDIARNGHLTLYIFEPINHAGLFARSATCAQIVRKLGCRPDRQGSTYLSSSTPLSLRPVPEEPALIKMGAQMT